MLQPLVNREEIRGRLLLDLVRQVEARIKELKPIEDESFAKPRAIVRQGEELWLEIKDVHGTTASELLNSSPHGLDPKVVAAILKSIVRVMRAYHSKGLVLGGVTPDCIIVDLDAAHGQEQEIRVAIFDPKIHHLLAPYRGINSKENNYVPPEVIKGQAWKQEQDIFAVGVTLYHLLTGILPFDDRDPAIVADNILQKAPLDPRVYNEDVSPEFVSLALKMLEKDTKERYKKGEEIESEIERLLAQGKVVASDEEKKAFSRKAGQVQVKEKAFEVQRFIRYRVGLIAGLAIIIVASLLLFQKGKVTPIITPSTTPEQVVSLYYKAIDDLNVQLLDEAIDSKAGANVTRWVTNLYVVERMNLAMALQQPMLPTAADETQKAQSGQEKKPQSQEEQKQGPQRGKIEAGKPGPGPGQVENTALKAVDMVKVTDLKITHLPSQEESPRFRATYRLTLPSEGGPKTTAYEDLLTLKRVEGKWRIVELNQKQLP
ncbi:MAG: hypothetical protein HPY52_10210 [Firmicutes bacterium]|nr:hypothetical protein [Bacillota bacterium]